MQRFLGAAAALLLVTMVQAMAGVSVRIDISAQRMYVNADGVRYEWTISTARPGYVTPVGTYHPYWLHEDHYSSKYDWAPMPHSIFFKGGYAIHGTTEVAKLGRPVSHGCVRLDPANAATLFALVQRAGMTNTTIVVEY